MDYIFEICKTIGPRIAGSPEEAKAADYLKKKLKPLSDKVIVEEFIALHESNARFYFWFTRRFTMGVREHTLMMRWGGVLRPNQLIAVASWCGVAKYLLFRSFLLSKFHH